METFWQDLRHGARLMLRSPGLSAAVVVALALGIGANTAIFSVVNAVLVRPLPYPDADRLMTVWATSLPEGEPYFASYPDVLDWRESRSFEELVAMRTPGFALTGEGEAEWVEGACVTSNFFAAVRVAPALGRAFTPEEDLPEGPRAAILGHGFWQRRFGGDPAALGRSVTLDGTDYTIVGVLPAEFAFPLGAEDADVWTTLALEGGNLRQRGAHVLRVVGRLAPGATAEGAQRELDAIAARLAGEYPDTNTDVGTRVIGLQERLAERIRPALWVLLGAVGLVLLIACANVANLLLVRTSARQRELVLRSALGASRGRVVRQLLTESLVLTLAGGAAGLGLAVWGVDLLAYAGLGELPRVNEVRVDATVFGFTLLLTVATGVAVGLAPALRFSERTLQEAMKDGGRGSTGGPGRRRLRGALVTAETALALVLLAGAGLLVKSFAKLTSVDPGFDARNVLTMRLAIEGPRYAEGEPRAEFVRRVVGDVRALPGVESAAFVTPAPFSNSGLGASFTIVGRPAPEPGHEPGAQFRAATPGLFRTLRIPLLAGREFADDDRKGGAGAAIVSESAARRFWPGESPVGKRIADVGVGVDGDEPEEWEIVGVVGDVKHRGLDEEARPEIWVPQGQQAWKWGDLVVRTAGEPGDLAGAVRGAVVSLDKDVPVFNVRPLDEMVGESVARERFVMLLLGVFAAAGLVLAAVGIYGVISYAVSERTQEIGIRMALGARRRDVLRLVAGGGLSFALAGLGLGLAGAVAVSRVMSGLLYDVSATDPLTLAAVAAILAAVALLACLVPARRAMRVEPMDALRHE